MSTTTLMLAGLAAAVTFSGGAAVAGTAAAPASDVPPVKGTDLPSVKEISQVYPYLKGGTRDVIGSRSFQVPDRADCLSIKQIGQAASGKWSSYAQKNGELPFFEGKEDAALFVYRFATKDKAERTMKRLDRFVRSCSGHAEEPGITADVARVPRLPALGDQRIGYRRDIGEGEQVTNHGLHVVVRRGRTLVEVYSQARDFAPDRARGVRLARLVLRTSAPS